MSFRYIIAGCVLFGLACQDIENADPMERNTFARFYESVQSREGVVAEPLEDGFIMLANSINTADTTGLIIRTDSRGRILWQTPLPGAILRSLAIANDGYFVLSDSIKVNPNSDQVADLIIYSVILYKIDLNGNPVDKYTITDTENTENRVDFKSSAMTMNSQNQGIMLGTFLTPNPGAVERPFVFAFDLQTLDTLWTKSYDAIDRDYINAKSIYATDDGHIVWATAILKEQQNFTRSYLAVPYIKEESVFENNDVYGATTDQSLLAGDICPSRTSGFGYGVVGTFASSTGENGNMFFARVAENGDILDASIRFFDGEASEANTPVTLGSSNSQDTGDAICSTADGGFALAGTMVTTPGRGHGGKDLFLVKVNATGDIKWNVVFGGTGDEVVNSIRETEDGGLLLCGSKDAAGLPALFLLKTDENGKLEN